MAWLGRRLRGRYVLLLEEETARLRAENRALVNSLLGTAGFPPISPEDDANRGVVVYMRQEGRGIGLPAKIQAYKLQEQGYDTVEANKKLGYGMDLREYGLGAQILADLGIKQIRLLTNNPKKVVGLEGYGMEIVEQVPIKIRPNKHNAKYLKTKREKLGHLI